MTSDEGIEICKIDRQEFIPGNQLGREPYRLAKEGISIMERFRTPPDSKKNPLGKMWQVGNMAV